MESSSSQPRKDIWNVPNILTISRILFSLLVFLLFPFHFYLTCFVLFIVGAITDFLDGWWARKFHLVTQFGRIVDSFADKTLVCGSYIYLVANPDLHNLFPPCEGSSCPFANIPLGLPTWTVVVVILRELLVTMLRSLIEAGGGDFSAKWVGKWKATFQFINIPMGILILRYLNQTGAAPCWLKVGFLITLYAVVFLTLYSGWVYIKAATMLLKTQNKD